MFGIFGCVCCVVCGLGAMIYSLGTSFSSVLDPLPIVTQRDFFWRSLWSVCLLSLSFIFPDTIFNPLTPVLSHVLRIQLISATQQFCCYVIFLSSSSLFRIGQILVLIFVFERFFGQFHLPFVVVCANFCYIFAHFFASCCRLLTYFKLL